MVFMVTSVDANNGFFIVIVRAPDISITIFISYTINFSIRVVEIRLTFHSFVYL